MVWGGLEVVWGVLGWFGVFPRTAHIVYFSISSSVEIFKKINII